MSTLQYQFIYGNIHRPQIDRLQPVLTDRLFFLTNVRSCTVCLRICDSDIVQLDVKKEIQKNCLFFVPPPSFPISPRQSDVLDRNHRQHQYFPIIGLFLGKCPSDFHGRQDDNQGVGFATPLQHYLGALALSNIFSCPHNRTLSLQLFLIFPVGEGGGAIAP